MAVGIECPNCGFPLASSFCPHCQIDVRPVEHINEATRKMKSGIAGFLALGLLAVVASYVMGGDKR